MATKINPGEQENGTWIIPSSSIQTLQHRIDVLNRRVQKTGNGGLSLTILQEVLEDVMEDGVSFVRPWTILQVSGAVPVISGWQFVARVEHHGELGNIISVAPDAPSGSLPKDVRTADATCDHCKSVRNRKDTFVLRNVESGDFCRVGRNCLVDFLRNTEIKSLLGIWSLISSVRSLLIEASESCGSGPEVFSTIGFLAATSSAIRKAGWVSKQKSRETGVSPTASLAAFIAGHPPKHGVALAEWKALRPTEADFEEAGEIVSWVETISSEGELNDYLLNLKTAILLGYVGERHEGIVASGVTSYRRHLEELKRMSELSGRPPSKHLGTKTERLIFKALKICRTREINNAFGLSTLVLFEDESGNDLKAFIKGSVPFVAGDFVKGKGTVKEHETYEGRAVTVLIRCKFEKIDTPLEALSAIDGCSEFSEECPF